MVLLEFFIDIILPAALCSTHSLTEMSTRNISWMVRGPVRMADHLTTIMCCLSWNLGASAFWNPQILYMPVKELLYSSLWSSRMISIWVKELRNVVCDGFNSQPRSHPTGYRCALRLCNTPALQENQLALFSCFVHKRVTETLLSCICGSGHRQL